jgi:hypothetical protein
MLQLHGEPAEMREDSLAMQFSEHTSFRSLSSTSRITLSAGLSFLAIGYQRSCACV